MLKFKDFKDEHLCFAQMEMPSLRCLRPESPGSDDELDIAQDEVRSKRRDKYARHVSYLRLMYQNSQANTAQAKRIISGQGDDFLRENRKNDVLANLVRYYTSCPQTAGQVKNLDSYIITI